MKKAELSHLVKYCFELNKNNNRDIFIREHLSLSRIFPDGTIKYCDNEVYSSVQNINKKSLIGQMWVLSGTWDIDSAEGFDWLLDACGRLINGKLIKFVDSPINYLKEELNEFLNFFFESKEVQKIKLNYIDEQTNGLKQGHLKPVVGGLYNFDLNQSFVSLICYYRQRDITKENYLAIANEFGIDASIRFVNTYQDWNDKDKRLIPGATSTRFKNRIKKIKLIIPYLRDSSSLERAQKDLKALESELLKL